MTGVFRRLRSWLGSLFGGGAGRDADDETDERQVAHRDERSLETPATMGDVDRPPAVGRTDDDATRIDRVSDPGSTDDDRGPVSIPDAEAVAGGTPATADDAPGGPSADAGDVGKGGPTDEGDDGGFACSVCGTAVEDPAAACPLCRSTDVVPAGAASDDGPSRSGRTTVVPTDGDDEAVDRLRDLGDG